jgi:hypothetical protein
LRFIVTSFLLGFLPFSTYTTQLHFCCLVVAIGDGAPHARLLSPASIETLVEANAPSRSSAANRCVESGTVKRERRSLNLEVEERPPARPAPREARQDRHGEALTQAVTRSPQSSGTVFSPLGARLAGTCLISIVLVISSALILSRAAPLSNCTPSI